MPKEKDYPLKLALVSISPYTKDVKLVDVRETAKFYVVDMGHYEAKYKKLDQAGDDGRVSGEEWGDTHLAKFSLVTECLYQPDSKMVTTIQTEAKRKALIDLVGQAVKNLLTMPDDPRIDQIASLLEIKVD